ncbi:hypothetical protein HG537_0D00880 [Torulaspora globosa]|uniref:Carboxypeptidase n=1 Tax=Torulaspora globosa TaxID=48254 RepID=A0A7H9HQR4_9SACH|nr:hypothetical protein HG537_0D00880 [Torulaspora sp. CBS 2947]
MLWYCVGWLASIVVLVHGFTASDYYVSPELIPGLSAIDNEDVVPEMYAGHIAFDGDDEIIKYFFWKFCHPKQYSDTLVFWFNGGPGCSSMDGALLETGPFRINSDGKAYLNPGSWHTRADIVYVDQPVGTGFSTSSSETPRYDNDLAMVTDHFMRFLDSYFQSFPDDLAKDIILAGESYAGQYLPFFADAIMKHNADLEDKYIKYDLKAVLIGNGWVDPNVQSLSYLPFAVEKGLIEKTNPHFSELLRAHEECQNVINGHLDGSDQKFAYEECEQIITLLLKFTRDTSTDAADDEVCLNVYDYTLRDSYPSCGMNWPIELPNIPKFFSTPGVMEALHLDAETLPRWHECDTEVLQALKNLRSKPSVDLLPSILESGVDILLFNGDHDLICNNKGVLDYVDNLNWGGQKGWSDKKQIYQWYHLNSESYAEEPAGYVEHDRNLTFISIYNASHMVANDHSLVSRGVLDIYMNNVLLEVIEGENFLLSADDLDILDEDEDDKKDSKENDETTDNETDNENYGDDSTPDLENNKLFKKSKNFIVTIMSLSLFGAICYYLYLKRFKRTRRAILVDRTNRHDNQNKTVSWADDLETGTELDPDQTQGRKFQTGGKKKNSYTRVPNTDLDESFELDDF